jgi:hypothetical protein
MPIACATALALASCGGDRQDKGEPKGNYKVEVVSASFPEKQKLAKTSSLRIVVRNADDKTIPNIAVTVSGFDVRRDDPDLADPDRPIFVINGRPKNIGGFPESKEAAPPGCETTYVNTWACGPLKPGRQKEFKWTVTAVRAGDFTLRYVVAAGLNGKAKAIDDQGGGRPLGVFHGTVDDKPPQTRVADDGHTVVNGTR